MHWLPAAFALIVMVAGWYYLFYSRAATGLAGIEAAGANARRAALRRVGGAVMLLLGVAIFIGAYTVNQERPTLAFAVIWGAVCLLLGAIVVLGAIDVRLTWKLRHRPKPPPGVQGPTDHR